MITPQLTGAQADAATQALMQQLGGDDESQSQAAQIVDFVKTRCEIFHDTSKDVYCTDHDSRETRRLDSRAFRDWLLAGFYKQTGKSVRDQALREALATLAGIGRHDGDEHSVHLRVAGSNGIYYIDLAEPGRNRAIKVEAERWQIVTDAHIRFTRTEAMQPLPEPQRGGNLTALWKIANIPEADRALVLAWLIECLRPETPFPVLELLGEQGSAKSTTQSALRRLIDPNACNLRGAPKVVEDIFVGAGVNWLMSFENISHLSAPMQDALCILATGGGFAKRKLYSDADEVVIHAQRPVVVNGISASITAQDLVDRTLTVETPTITRRAEGGDLWRQFDAYHGHLLGALLDVFAAALKALPDIRLNPEDRPRLAEFVRLGMAIGHVTGTGADAFLEHFNASRRESISRTIDASPVASALIDWFEHRNQAVIELPVKELFTALEAFRPNGTDSWPRSAKGLGDALRRAAPALRTLGIECRSSGKIGGSIRWKISPGGKKANPSPDCPEGLNSAQKVSNEQDIRTFRTSSPGVSTDEGEVF